MMDDTYIYVITALLPLSACMVVVQKNPYHALVIRGILGAVAALVYAVLGAADVALTEALVGTMLAITLYAVAVRSSMNMRLGVLEEDLPQLQTAGLKWEKARETDAPLDQVVPHGSLMGHLRTLLKKHYMRLELVPYPDHQTLQDALINRDIHAICLPPDSPQDGRAEPEFPSYSITTRIRRLYDLMEAELPLLAASLIFLNVADTNSAEKSLVSSERADTDLSTVEEVPS
jgi:putative multicomponent Na+:H+ antiporter subunit B